MIGSERMHASQAPPHSAVRRKLVASIWPHLVYRYGDEDLSRVRGLLDCWAGAREPSLAPLQEAEDGLFLPGLEPDPPWLDPSIFPCAASMVAQAEALREELDSLLAEHSPLPYGSTDGRVVSTNPEGWDYLPIYLHARLTPLAARAPIARRLAEEALEFHAYLNQVVFLALRPGVELDLHVDPANFLVSCHLGLRVPGSCALRVGDEERPWIEGGCIAFNNSYLHRAYNHSDAVRWVLAVHGLHPGLSRAERLSVRDFYRAVRRSLGVGLQHVSARS